MVGSRRSSLCTLALCVVVGCTGPASNVAPDAAPAQDAAVINPLPACSVGAASASVDTGGGAASGFVADRDFQGGTAYGSGHTVDTTGVADAAPADVYRTYRYGQTASFAYAFTGLAAGSPQRVRLHFAETFNTAATQRLFDVAINGQTRLHALDVFVQAGGADRALVETLFDRADATGTLTITFAPLAGHDSAMVSGLEVAPASGGCAAASDGGMTNLPDATAPTDAAVAADVPVVDAGPCTGIAVAAGADLQSAIDAHPAGTTFCLAAATYRISAPLAPRSNDQFIGATGTVISGGRVLAGFAHVGAAWSIGGQTQNAVGHGDCESSHPLCDRLNTVAYDDRLLDPVPSMSALAPGRYYLDDPGDTIYLADDPTGHRVEAGITGAAVGNPMATGVLLRGIDFELFANDAQTGAVGDMGSGWTMDGCTFRLNHGTGIQLGTHATLRGGLVAHNGQMGIGGGQDGSVVDSVEIANNNDLGFDPGWEAGGTKFAFATHLEVRNCYVHDNHGPGLWTDISNRYITYENNRVVDNDGAGIFHEISYDAVIRNNTITHNGGAMPPWLWSAGIQIAASKNVEVYGNTLTDNGNGIALIQQNRGGPADDPWIVQNVYVHDNTVVNSGGSGMVQDFGSSPDILSRNNRFANNHYTGGSFDFGSAMDWSAWQAHGQDATGSYSAH